MFLRVFARNNNRPRLSIPSASSKGEGLSKGTGLCGVDGEEGFDDVADSAYCSIVSRGSASPSVLGGQSETSTSARPVLLTAIKKSEAGGLYR